MKEVSIEEVLPQFPVDQHPQIMRDWQDQDVEYLVFYRTPTEDINHYERVGPNEKIRTFQKIFRQQLDKRFPSSYVRSMHFILRTLEYHEKEISERISRQKQREDELSSRLQLAREADDRERERVTDPRTGEKIAKPVTRPPIALDERQEKLRKRERELNELFAKIDRERNDLLQRQKYITEVEEALMARLEEVSLHEAELEQKREEIEARELKLLRSENGGTQVKVL